MATDAEGKDCAQQEAKKIYKTENAKMSCGQTPVWYDSSD